MIRSATALAVCLALAAPVAAQPAQNRGVQTRYLGDMTCGGWRSAPASFTSIQKAALLNWVLGFLSGRTMEREDDVLQLTEVSAIAAWLDDYCSRNPLDYLATAAFKLEADLIARQRRAVGRD